MKAPARSDAEAAGQGPVVEVVDLYKDYTLPRESLFKTPPTVHALRGVSLSVSYGRSLGIVGESGSGKSTLARTVMGLEAPSSGTVRVLGQDIGALEPGALRRLRRDFQMVFQDPFGSLDPRRRVGMSIAEPLDALERVSPAERRASIVEVLGAVGLNEGDGGKYPHEFSGGQRQRIAIARALITRPALIVADEPVSSLDVSVQAQVLNLMQDLRDDYEITYLVVSHDLAVVETICDDVAVMNEGVLVEAGPVERIFSDPRHPYTCALIEAVPQIAG